VKVALTSSIGRLNFKRGLSWKISFVYNIFSILFSFRTSPVLVPSHAGGNGHHRQRLESTSSLSVGSWQLISGTGSLRSQDSNIVVINEQHHHHNIANNNLLNSNIAQAPSHPQNMFSNHPSANGGSTQTSTLIDEDCFTANDYFMRRERLNTVRTLFYNCFSSTIGYKYKEEGFGTLLGNFAEKVGLTQRTSV
jgi:myotubularin-related protein 14